MRAPNLFLIYVSDAESSAAFYSHLFEIEPTFTSQRYVASDVAPGVLFALWTGRNQYAVPRTTRTSELGLMIPGPVSAVDETFTRCVAKAPTSWRSRTTTSSAAHSGLRIRTASSSGSHR